MYTFKASLKNLVKRSFQNIIIETKDQSNRNLFVVASHKPLLSYNELYLGNENNVFNKFSFSFNLKKKFSDFSKNSGLVVIRDSSVAKKFRDKVLMQPNFIELEIPLPDTIEDYNKLVTGDVRNNLKKVKKIDFIFSVSYDLSWFEEFYTNYYRPSMMDRHDDAYIMAKSEMASFVNQPGVKFLKINLNDQCVAAAVVMIKGEKYSYAKVGWLNGDVKILEMGAVTAIYKYIVERAFAVGSKVISLGGTPPFLESGVLRYKAKWQSKFNPEIFYGENYLLLSPSINACYNFLQNNSLLVFGLNNELIVLSGKTRAETHIPGIIFDDIKGWFLLKSERSDSYPEGMDDLPEHLRYWYDKVSSQKV